MINEIKLIDFEIHAILLCSFLLGFAMDSFVVVGTTGEGPHLWVLTRSKNEKMLHLLLKKVKEWLED